MTEDTIRDLIDLLGKSTSNSLNAGERALWKAQRDHLVAGLQRELRSREQFSEPNPGLDSLGAESFDSLLTPPGSGV